MASSETGRGQGRVAVAGCGHWGRNHVRNFAELGALVAVHDVDPAAAQNAATAFGVPVVSWAAVLDDPDVDAVVIATPAAQHADMAREALLAGKDVFVEKPLALDTHDGQAVVDLAESLGRVLMVGHLLHYHPAFLKLAELVHGGRLGKLQYLYSNRLNFGKFRREEDILWSFAPHDVSMILHLVGSEPETVETMASAYLQKEIADVTTTHLTFRDGTFAHIFVSWLHPFKEHKLVVVGDQGMAVFDDAAPWADKLRFYAHAVAWHDGAPEPTRAEPETVPLEEAEPLRMECAHFLDCVRTRARPRTDGREGLRVLSVLQSARESMMRRGHEQ